jgi:hypothetical protein
MYRSIVSLPQVESKSQYLGEKIWGSTKHNDYSHYWMIESWNKSDSKKLLNVYAICLSGVEGKTTSVIQYVTIPANATGRAAVPSYGVNGLII